MDDGLHEPLRQTRLLAWVTAGLLVAGLVSAGAVTAQDNAADRRVVSAAGSGAEGVETPTTTAFVPPPTSPPTTSAPTTTPPAPPTTAAKPVVTVPPTTQAPRTTTTRPPVATTTTVLAPAGVMLTVLNTHSFALTITVNGRTFTLAPGERSGPVAISRYSHGNDIVEARLVQEPTCGMGDADGYFPTPGNYLMTVVESKGLCQPGMPGIEIRVTPA